MRTQVAQLQRQLTDAQSLIEQQQSLARQKFEELAVRDREVAESHAEVIALSGLRSEMTPAAPDCSTVEATD